MRVVNWIWTLEGIQQIWQQLHKANFERLNVKILNQDCLENFFSQIRNFTGSNQSPSPKQFKEAFKALLISNLTSKHSLEANCAEDHIGKSFALSRLFNLSEVAQQNTYEEADEDIDTQQEAVPEPHRNEVAIDTKKILIQIRQNTDIKECPTCSTNVNNAKLASIIEHIGNTLELQFIKMCSAPKITQVIQTFLAQKYGQQFQCQHLRTTLFQTVATEFVTTW